MNKLVGLFTVVTLLLTGAGQAFAVPDSAPWVHEDENGQQRLDLYFFWSKRCPHCLAAKPVVEKIAAERGWLQLHSLELTQSRDNIVQYIRMASELGQEARSVPAFLYCGKMEVGFDGRGDALRDSLDRCHRQLQGAYETTSGAGRGVELPLFGRFEQSQDSLLLVTVVIAALDAFNPCAFFVLLFLLSLLVNSRSRKRMLYIGGIFVFFSGALYFVFMAAWLNLFLLTGMQPWLTTVAGIVAVALALINIKDFFLPGHGMSLSISEDKKPGLFKRTRALLQANNLVALTFGTIALALAANSYELLCTSGLPMVYTRVLTLEGLPALDYYLYLLLYNVIYVIPLMVIVLLFSLTLGKRKLQPQEGRLLKLLSGVMMIELGVGLVVAPELLSSVTAVALAMLIAVVVTSSAGMVLKRRS